MRDQRGLSSVEFVTAVVLVCALAVAVWNLFGNALAAKLRDGSISFDSLVVTGTGEAQASLGPIASASGALSGTSAAGGDVGSSGARGGAPASAPERSIWDQLFGGDEQAGAYQGGGGRSGGGGASGSWGDDEEDDGFTGGGGRFGGGGATGSWEPAEEAKPAKPARGPAADAVIGAAIEVAVAESASESATPTNPEGQCVGDACGKTSCFVAGTPVHTARGLRAIESLHVGDLVWSRDDRTGAQALKPIVQTFTTPDRVLLGVELRDDDGVLDALRVTPPHPFWTRRGWVAAEDLTLHDEVLARDGSWEEVARAETLDEGATVYNFEVADFHTYFVGETGAWVHNQADGECPPRRDSKGRVVPPGVERLPSGRYPANAVEYAGKTFDGPQWTPELAQRYPEGVRFNERGFPDFGPYASKSVTIEGGFAGNRSSDFTKANAQAGLKSTPEGYIWHHNEDGKTMQLVPEDMHEAVRHAGGVALKKPQKP